jgi:saccharopine dehydrogenase (NAD+, L-lysine-forming)
MKVLIVGAGGQGGACASILARFDEIEEIRLGDLKSEIAEKVRSQITVGQDKITSITVNATDSEDVANAAAGMDIVVDMVMPWMVPYVMRGALKAGANYINTAFDTPFWEEFREGKKPEQLTLYNEFKEAGLTALFGCGFAPGWTNVIARKFANMLHTVDTIKMRVGKVSQVPDESPYDWIFRKWNPGWSPKQALIDCASPTFAFEDGKFVKYEPYAGIEICPFPKPMGEQPVTHHSHEENYSMPFTFNDVKNVEFKYNLQPQPAIFYVTGLLNRDTVEVDGVKIKPLDLVASLIQPPADNIFGATDEQLAYADKTALVELVVQVSGTKDGKPVTYTANCPKMNAPGPELKKLFGTALVYVALPLAVGVLTIGQEDLPKGIIFADQLDPDKFIERMMGTGYPYKWTETAS